MSPFCEICEEPFTGTFQSEADCIICGQSCCIKCIDPHYRICKDCDTTNKPENEKTATPHE